MINKFLFAGILGEREISYSLSSEIVLHDLNEVRVLDVDREIKVTGASTLGRSAKNGTVEVSEPLDITRSYTLLIKGLGSRLVVPMGIFDSEYFKKKYCYDGDDLGSVIGGSGTAFKVWAPTASCVVLNLFRDGHKTSAYKTVKMIRGDKGVWSCTDECGHGTYYTYTVTTALGTAEAADPYAKAAGVNGERSMVVDLSLTDPKGFCESRLKNNIKNYSEAVIWEVHVRDFSNRIDASKYKGKYLAFTESGLVNENGESVGVDYLKKLGVTHVHLLPVYDYATVDESDPQAPFNWGYDPKNYNVPEGSYSTDPYNGEVRIKEYKAMVSALHEAGIGVVMDVVYNHTYEADSAFNKIVPYYYYRYTSDGENTSASGCGNDTASERYMFSKFMVDSTSYWVGEYKLDGLRFDLMGLHDLETMKKIERAVHSVNPNAIIYGEGWCMGATVDGSPQANQMNINEIKPTGNAIGSIAVFNDIIRDGLKGSVFLKDGRGYINGAPTAENLSSVEFGISGGGKTGKYWRVDGAMVVNYMSAHDNHTLFDKLALSNADSSLDERVKMNKLGAAIIMISKGTPFFLAGEEMLRTKGGDENSYKSSDAVNNIDWSVLKKGSAEYSTMLYYKGLIEMRKAFGIFSDLASDISCKEEANGLAVITFEKGNGESALALINPYEQERSYTLEGEWNLVADGTRAGSEAISREDGSVDVDGISVKVYVNDALINR